MQGMFDVLDLTSGIRHSETLQKVRINQKIEDKICNFIKGFKNSILQILLTEKNQVIDRKVMAW